jgi:hypothetical protein
LRAQAILTHQDAHDPAFANTTGQLALGYFQDLPKGFTVSLEPSLAVSSYDGPFAAFGRRREDQTWVATAGVLNRALAWREFSPRLSVSRIETQSDIPIYRFRKTRVELRLTRAF